jgi:oligosaccharide repeat unit polymerase
MGYTSFKKNSIVFIACLVSGLIIFSNSGARYSIPVLLGSFIIACYSLINMFEMDGKPYSLNKIFYIFIFFFFALAPALQFKNNATFWGVKHLANGDYLLTDIIIIASMAIYDFFYRYFSSKPLKKIKQFKSLKKRKPRNKSFVLFILITVSISSFIFYFYTQDFNMLSLIVRGARDFDSTTSSSIKLIIKIFIRPLPIISLVTYHIYYRKFDLWEGLLLIIAFISNFPTVMARFQAAALYIPLLILYFKPVRKNINFSLTLGGGILILYPFLNIFRRFVMISSFSFSHIYENMFISANFEAYQNLLVVIKHHIITYGHQLLGVFFFFVPRSAWGSKPVGSGFYIAKKLSLTFSNISMPYFGEGYINFGFIGILLFCIFLAFLNSSIDKRYWQSTKYPFVSVYYLFLLGMEFFLMRGDLLSSFAYTVGLVAAIYMVFRLTTKKKKTIIKPVQNNIKQSKSNKFYLLL